jgi:hypothetical protein
MVQGSGGFQSSVDGKRMAALPTRLGHVALAMKIPE